MREKRWKMICTNCNDTKYVLYKDITDRDNALAHCGYCSSRENGDSVIVKRGSLNDIKSFFNSGEDR